MEMKQTASLLTDDANTIVVGLDPGHHSVGYAVVRTEKNVKKSQHKQNMQKKQAQSQPPQQSDIQLSQQGQATAGGHKQNSTQMSQQHKSQPCFLTILDDWSILHTSQNWGFQQWLHQKG